MSPAVNDLLLLAAEGHGIPPDHIAAKIAVPLGLLIFGGAVYLLLWSNYGAKKAAGIYGTAFFAFTTMLGIFWWFSAPGGLVAGGLRNFPGQPAAAYSASWFAFEQGSERAEFFPATNNVSDFETVESYLADLPSWRVFLLGSEDYAASLKADMALAGETIVQLYLPKSESGAVRIGARRRQSYINAAGDPKQGEARAQPFFSATAENVKMTYSNDTLVAAGTVVVSANFVDPATTQVVRSVVVDEQTVFAFKDPGSLWFPSAVWTAVSFVLFLLSLWALDRMEMREKRLEREEVEEPEDLAVPIKQ